MNGLCRDGIFILESTLEAERATSAQQISQLRIEKAKLAGALEAAIGHLGMASMHFSGLKRSIQVLQSVLDANK